MTYLDTSHNDAPTEGNNDYRFLSYNILFFFGQFYSDVIKIHLLEPICIVKDLLRERRIFKIKSESLHGQLKFSIDFNSSETFNY